MKFERVNPISLFLFSLLVAAYPAAAQKGEASKPARLPLWKVEGITNKVYLLGSIHLLSETNYPLPAPMETAFSNAQVVAFEADVGEMMKLETQMRLMAKCRLAEGESLKELLSAETYGKVMAYASNSVMPQMMFTQFKPAFIALTIVSAEAMKMGMNPLYGIDLHFYNQAKDTGKQVVGLETFDFQAEMIAGMSKEEGEWMLKSTFKQLETEREKFGDLVAAWQTGNSKGLDDLMNESVGESPTLTKRLLTDRNESWVPKIQEMMSGGKNAIVIVGAAHLVGEKGVVELLKKKGVKITQMTL
jgi:uncharacterized protein YbaP (TraB family)